MLIYYEDGTGEFLYLDHYKARYICIRTELTGHNVERRIYCCKGSQILFRLDKNFRWTIILICSQLRKFVILFSVQHVSRIDIPMLDYYLHSITVRVSVSPFRILIYCSLTFSSLQRTNKFLATENSAVNNENNLHWLYWYLHISLFLWAIGHLPPQVCRIVSAL